jgi:CBS domain-containing protein
MEKKDLFHSIQSACVLGVQLIPPTILCDSIGSLGLKDPFVVAPETPLAECFALMQQHHVGSVLITGQDGRLQGIFTERDCLMKVAGKLSSLENRTVSEFMTKNPIRERPDASLAFALNLMSNGGFRHVPIVDQDDIPIGIISVKDVVEHIVAKMLAAIYEAVETVEE